MNAPLQDAAHREAQDALPWLANGTLTGAELARVEAHLETCAQCRADLDLLHTLRAAGAGPDVPCDAEAALARLLPRLDAPAAPMPQPMPQPAPAPTVPRWRDRIAVNDPRWLRAAVAVQFGAIAVLAVLLARGERAPGPGDYRVLGAGKAAEARLVVVFRPETPERELRRIVHAHGARIVGGPTTTDAYLLDTDGAPAHALAGLRAEAAVTLAEPLALEGAP